MANDGITRVSTATPSSTTTLTPATSSTNVIGAGAGTVGANADADARCDASCPDVAAASPAVTAAAAALSASAAAATSAASASASTAAPTAAAAASSPAFTTPAALTASSRIFTQPLWIETCTAFSGSGFNLTIFSTHERYVACVSPCSALTATAYFQYEVMSKTCPSRDAVSKAETAEGKRAGSLTDSSHSASVKFPLAITCFKGKPAAAGALVITPTASFSVFCNASRASTITPAEGRLSAPRARKSSIDFVCDFTFIIVIGRERGGSATILLLIARRSDRHKGQRWRGVEARRVGYWSLDLVLVLVRSLLITPNLIACNCEKKRDPVTCCEVSLLAALALPAGASPTCCSIGGGGWFACASGRDVFSFLGSSPLGRARLGDLVYALACAPLGISSAHLMLGATRAGPLALIDADRGVVAATLAARDANEESSPLFASAWSLARYARAWGGGDSALYEFDVARGCAVSSRSTAASSKGRIAAVASAPDASGLVACGSLDSGTVSLHDERGNGGRVVCTVDDVDDEGSGGSNKSGGCTAMRFSTCGRVLYAGYRRHGAVVSWDLRGSSQRQRVLCRFPRDDSAGQRLGFDVAPFGSRELLATASRDGRVLIYDIASCECDTVMDDWMSNSPPVDVGFFDCGALAVLSGPRHGEEREGHEADRAEHTTERPTECTTERTASFSVWGNITTPRSLLPSGELGLP